MDTTNLLELIGAVIGLAYIILEYKASPWMWLCGVLMPLAYMWIYFRSGLYANAAFNAYSVVISAYGLRHWLRGGDDKGEAPIRSFPRRRWPLLAGVVLVLAAVLAWLLGFLEESQAPLLDGLTTSLSIVGMWMLARKYYQQWLCWLLVEPLTMVMCLAAGLWATAALYAVYTVVALLGYFKWKKD